MLYASLAVLDWTYYWIEPESSMSEHNNVTTNPLRTYKLDGNHGIRNTFFENLEVQQLLGVLELNNFSGILTMDKVF